ncbi:AraC family transcriptional regulator [Paenibacillus lupini]|uniref:helix-turn-helix domain-containing protein n=1 Tax=Paenibacillus lupini TaxID=1450204 RepID=UPI001423D5EB|nr:AraC-like DNA-binding protein [Paenibacillus lupini]
MKDYLYDPLPEDLLTLHKSGRNFSSVFHRHDGYEIYLFLHGNVNFYFEQFCYKLKKGDLIFIRPDEFHRAVCLDSSLYERIVINIKQSYIERLSTPQSDLHRCFEGTLNMRTHIISLNEPTMSELTRLVHKLQEVVDSKKYGDDLLVDVYLSQILIMINIAFQSEKAEGPLNIMPKLLVDITQLIEAHLSDTVTLQLLSAKLFLNGTYISRKFKEYTGLTLQQYLVDKRIALAKQHLTEGKSVTETCYLSGFKNYSNFIRTFTKQTGISPGRYRSIQM